MSKNEQDNNLTKQFWEEVAAKIESDYQYGPPNNWTKAERENFLKNFLPEITKKKPSNYKVENPGLSEATFRRIFISKESQGTNTTRDIFSWYLGYSNFFEYKAKRNSPSEKKRPIFLYLIALIALGLISLSFYMFMPQKEVISEEEKELIDLVKDANQFEFGLGAHLQDFEKHLDSSDFYFLKNEAAHKAVVSYLKANKAKNYTLLLPNEVSRQETFDARCLLYTSDAADE